MVGTQDPATSIFVIPQANGAPPIKITGFSSFVTTRAAAYCFLPSITAIKFISSAGMSMLFLTRMFGVTGSDAERDLGDEQACIEAIVDKVLLLQANSAVQQHRTLGRGTHVKGTAARALFEVYDVKTGRDPAWQRASQRAFSRRPASIPQSYASRTQTRR